MMLGVGSPPPIGDEFDFGDEGDEDLNELAPDVIPEGACFVPVRHHVNGHPTMISLTTVGRDTQILQHHITGEAIRIPAADGEPFVPWKLKFYDGYGAIERVDQNLELQKEWVNNHFMKQLWRSGDNLVVKHVDASGREHLDWHSDNSTRATVSYASWPASPLYREMPLLEVVEFLNPRDSATVFLNLKNLQDSAKFVTKFAQGSGWYTQMRGRWIDLLTDVGLSESHLHRPVSGTQISDIRLQSPHATVVVSLLVFVNGHSYMQKREDKESCMRMFKDLLENFIGNSFDVPESVDAVDDIHRFKMKVENWKVVEISGSWRMHLGDDFS